MYREHFFYSFVYVLLVKPTVCKALFYKWQARQMENVQINGYIKVNIYSIGKNREWHGQ